MTPRSSDEIRADLEAFEREHAEYVDEFNSDKPYETWIVDVGEAAVGCTEIARRLAADAGEVPALREQIVELERTVEYFDAQSKRRKAELDRYMDAEYRAGDSVRAERDRLQQVVDEVRRIRSRWRALVHGAGYREAVLADIEAALAGVDTPTLRRRRMRDDQPICLCPSRRGVCPHCGVWTFGGKHNVLACHVNHRRQSVSRSSATPTEEQQ